MVEWFILLFLLPVVLLFVGSSYLFHNTSDSATTTATTTTYVPCYQSRVPVVGTVWGFFKAPHSLLAAARKQCGDVFTLNALFCKFTIVSGKEGQKIFFRSSKQQVGFDEAREKFLGPVLGHVLSLENPIYRQLVTKGLRSQDAVDLYVKICLQECAVVFQNWTEKTDDCNRHGIDLVQSVKDLFMKIFIKCFLGETAVTRHYKQITSSLNVLHSAGSSASNTLLHDWWFGGMLDSVKQSRKAREVLYGAVEACVQDRQQNAEKFKDKAYVSYWVEAANVEIADIISHLTEVLFAAYINTIPLFVCSLINLNILNDSKRPCEVDTESKTFLKSLIMETARTMQHSLMLRKVLQPLCFQDKTIPAGNYLCLYKRFENMDAEVFENPTTFDSNRFMQEGSESPLMFGVGKHRCPGDMLAMEVIMESLALFDSKYRICTTNNTSLPDPSSFAKGTTGALLGNLPTMFVKKKIL